MLFLKGSRRKRKRYDCFILIDLYAQDLIVSRLGKIMRSLCLTRPTRSVIALRADDKRITLYRLSNAFFVFKRF